MDAGVIAAIVAVAVVVIAIAAYFIAQARRRSRLRQRFGPEYERANGVVESRQDRRTLEADLADRADRRDHLQIRELPEEARESYIVAWRRVQAQFVDQPGAAVHAADELVGDVMRDRGYPMHSSEDQADLISVDHPEVVEHYRAGHAIAEAHARNAASTEDLRQAFLRYRSLFAELLGEPVKATTD
jgi:hypothetical protein